MKVQEEIPLRCDVTSYQEKPVDGNGQPEAACEAGNGHSDRTHFRDSLSTDPEINGYSLSSKIFRTVAIDAAYFGAVSIHKDSKSESTSKLLWSLRLLTLYMMMEF